ncbi:MAG: cytochrome D ubiquinol oxidase subunit II, partial [Pseudomonas helleri]
ASLNLYRLSFAFSGRNQGRLRELVDFINLPQHWEMTDMAATSAECESLAD